MSVVMLSGVELTDGHRVRYRQQEEKEKEEEVEEQEEVVEKEEEEVEKKEEKEEKEEEKEGYGRVSLTSPSFYFSLSLRRLECQCVMLGGRKGKERSGRGVRREKGGE
ncbi:hypothetical protein Pmani_037195 [Petrolisthes manimaculis]|uniref:Uncharacterized protein n=1 Tax=Petrolisthes manimaculis TaxID=1843537 RepID=A0AAE1NHR2_9EUCA|nr:hypothetical protein Pmani_037195 [Petrolisthes manimaculis]